jgi:long-chain acyl-CoA synthetase
LTGDVAMVFENGSIKIVDRSKNIFKLSQGEYIAPEKLENIYVLSPLIASSMIYGDSLKSCLVAIVIPEEAEVDKWMKSHEGLSGASEVTNDPEFKKEIMDSMAALAKENNLSSLEKPKDIHISLDPFTVENN